MKRPRPRNRSIAMLPRRSVSAPETSASDHDACAAALELMMENLCQEARDAGWADVAIGAAIVKLGGAYLQETLGLKP